MVSPQAICGNVPSVDSAADMNAFINNLVYHLVGLIIAICSE